MFYPSQKHKKNTLSGFIIVKLANWNLFVLLPIPLLVKPLCKINLAYHTVTITYRKMLKGVLEVERSYII